MHAHILSPSRRRVVWGLPPSGAITYDAAGNPVGVSTGTIALLIVGGLLVWAVIFGGIYYVVKAFKS